MFKKDVRDATRDFGRDGYYDNTRTCTSGEAYFLAQVIGDVDRAFDGLARDFRAGDVDPDAWTQRSEFKDLVRDDRDRPRFKTEYALLETAFADGGIEANMDALADAFDTFETRRAQALSAPASGARIALQLQIEQFRSDLTQRGTAGLSYVVDALLGRVLDRLVILRSDEVRLYAGGGRETNPAAVIATLSGAPVSEVRTRANRGNAVRQLSESLLRIDLDDWSTSSNDQLVIDCAPLANWPREAPYSGAETTDNGSVDDCEAERVRIQRRNESWSTMS